MCVEMGIPGSMKEIDLPPGHMAVLLALERKPGAGRATLDGRPVDCVAWNLVATVPLRAEPEIDKN